MSLSKPLCRFTIIELLVVIAILTILFTFFIPAFRQAKEQAKGVACMNNMRQLYVMQNLYADDNRGKLLPGKLANHYQPHDWGLRFAYLGYIDGDVQGQHNAKWFYPVFACPDGPRAIKLVGNSWDSANFRRRVCYIGSSNVLGEGGKHKYLGRQDASNTMYIEKLDYNPGLHMENMLRILGSNHPGSYADNLGSAIYPNALIPFRHGMNNKMNVVLLNGAVGSINLRQWHAASTGSKTNWYKKIQYHMPYAITNRADTSCC